MIYICITHLLNLRRVIAQYCPLWIMCILVIVIRKSTLAEFWEHKNIKATMK